MTGDATFEDGRDKPLNLRAIAADDLEILSSLCQDAVFPVREVSWNAKRREFAVLLNRFRWEDQGNAELGKRPYERVQSVLVFTGVMKVSAQGVGRDDPDLILSLLSVSFEPGEDCDGRVVLTLSGDGALALDVECLEATLRDVSRPYAAPSGRVPDHS